MTVSPSRSCLIDLSDLFAGLGQRNMPGMNRVCFAYLAKLIRSGAPVTGMIRHRYGVMLLDRDGMERLAQGVIGTREWDKPMWRDLVRGDLPPLQRAALSTLRRMSLDRCLPKFMPRMLARHLAPGSAVVLLTMANTDPDTLAEFRAAGLKPVVMIHDTIPLDFPEYVAQGAGDGFERRLAAIGKMASVVLYNSLQTRADAEGHFKRLGRVPPGLVAHLGVPPMRPAPEALSALPSQVDLARPFFVVLGAIEPRKNHAMLLKVWERLSERPETPPQLLILGPRSTQVPQVSHWLDTHALSGHHVHELAGLPDGAVAALIDGARALLFPSHCEGFGLPAVEAAQLGTPVICNDLPVYREFLASYPIFANSTDADAWLAAIDDVMSGTTLPRPAPPPLPTWDQHFAKVLPRILPG